MLRRLVPLGTLLFWLGSDAARAASIVFSNPSLRVFNGVSVHTAGAPFTTSLLSDDLTGAPPEVELSHDFDFASAAALARPAALYASSRADARDVGPLGYDEVVAEGGAHYTTDFRISGGSGPVDLLLTTSQVVDASTDEPGFGVYSLRAIRLFRSGEVFYGMPGEFSSDVVRLRYEALYHLEVDFSAYSRASLGHLTANERELQVGLEIVPEPAAGALLALGLWGIALRARRQRW